MFNHAYSFFFFFDKHAYSSLSIIIEQIVWCTTENMKNFKAYAQLKLDDMPHMSGIPRNI